VLVKTLIGIDYEYSVIAVGVLMLAYVMFGGMVATHLAARSSRRSCSSLPR